MIMTYNHLPWDEIKSPNTDLNLLRVDDSHSLDFSWGKDSTGRILLVLKFKIADSHDLHLKHIELTGIKSDICKIESIGLAYFQLTLQSKENADIFHTLCNDLIEKTRSLTSIDAALSVIYSRLERWRALLSKSNRGLSPQKIQGLFGELKFLEECIDNQIVSLHAAVEGWKGPLGAPHDFIFGQTAIEIKTVSTSSADSVRISTESQLTTHLSTLYLRVIFLARDEDCNKGVSLNTLVSLLKEKIQSHDLVQIFDQRLAEIGYIDIPEYDYPCFSVVKIKTFQVKEGFPRISSESLSAGISNVSYDISFNSIEKYSCEYVILEERAP